MRRLRRAARARLASSPPPTAPLAEAEIVAGPLRGRRLLIPAPGSDYFRRVVSGREDGELWDEAGRLDPAGVGVVFDVGGYVGLHALSWAALFPAARVVTFEPAAINRGWLERNLALNPDLGERVTVRPVCVADFEGEAEFRTSDNIRSGHSSSSTLVRSASARISPPDLIAEVVRVPVTTLDVAAAELGWPDLIKVDVENGEPAVLRGGPRALERARSIMCEVHTPGSMLACAGILGERLLGAAVLKEEPDGRVFLALRRARER